MQEAEAIAFIEAQPWEFARTMAHIPHEYIVRKQVNDDPTFTAFVNFIRKNGRERSWGRRRFIYWYAPDGRRYWSMGWPCDETTVINRSPVGVDDTTEPNPSHRWSSHNGQRPELL